MKKRKIRKVEKKKGKVKNNKKIIKKKWGRITVDYCCNPQ